MRTIRFPAKSIAARRRANRQWGEPADRFWKKVAKRTPEECWLWTGSKATGDGYGGIRVDGSSWLTHRYSFFLTFGDFDRTLKVLHKCDNPPCCNPAHLFLGTMKENAMDMVRKGRNYIRQGEASSAAKLKEETVIAILKDRDAGMSRWQLARKYNTPETTIGHIVTGENWKHLGYVPKQFTPQDFRGEQNGASKVTEAIVAAIRVQYLTGIFSYTDLAKLYHIGTQTVAHIIKRRSWKHVP